MRRGGVGVGEGGEVLGWGSISDHRACTYWIVSCMAQ